MEEQFEALPQIIRQLGPWAGSYEGEVMELKPAYRALLAEQGFVVIYAHVSKLSLITRSREPSLALAARPSSRRRSSAPAS